VVHRLDDIGHKDREIDGEATSAAQIRKRRNLPHMFRLSLSLSAVTAEIEDGWSADFKLYNGGD